MKRAYLEILLIIALFAIVTMLSCKSSDRTKTSTKSTIAVTENALQIPAKKSMLAGWHGIKVKKCGSECCELVFPENYGLMNKQQLMTLKELVSKNIEHDVDCSMQVSTYALNQIRHLAVEKQDRDAAMMLLSPSQYNGFNLDGELAEEYAGEYQLAVLEGYQSLNSILDKTISEDVSTSVCSWVEVLGEKAGAKRLRKLVPVLKSKNLGDLAQMLSEKCKAVL
jgi:hypothetical protein